MELSVMTSGHLPSKRESCNLSQAFHSTKDSPTNYSLYNLKSLIIHVRISCTNLHRTYDFFQICKPLEWDILEISACFFKAKPMGHLFKDVAQCEDLSQILFLFLFFPSWYLSSMTRRRRWEFNLSNHLPFVDANACFKMYSPITLQNFF